MAQLRSDKAEVVALWLETLLYGTAIGHKPDHRENLLIGELYDLIGIYLVHFQQSLAYLTYKRTTARLQWLLICVSLGIFGLATAVSTSELIYTKGKLTTCFSYST